MAIALPPPQQRKWWIVGTIAVLIGVVLAAWWGISASEGISWQTVSYRVVDDQTVSITFDITNQDGRPAVCDLHALDFDRNQVGVSTVQLPGTDLQTARYTRTVRTLTKPVMGEVVECRRR